MTRMIQKLLIFTIFSTLLLGLTTCAMGYKMGEVGPAGGYIFYDKGKRTDGWRYLEAAPPEYEFTTPWGLRWTVVAGTKTTIGSGKRNTDILVKLAKNDGTENAASKCNQLVINGYKDWFLPSKDELDLMYRNLKQRGLGGFGNNFYWSSSEYHSVNAWGQDFFNGKQDGYFKSNLTPSVRAVRAF